MLQNPQTHQFESFYGIALKRRTRLTFFRVKLVFECDFQISWSLGPWDFGSEGCWDLGTIGSWDHQEGCQMTIEFKHEDKCSKLLRCGTQYIWNSCLAVQYWLYSWWMRMFCQLELLFYFRLKSVNANFVSIYL